MHTDPSQENLASDLTTLPESAIDQSQLNLFVWLALAAMVITALVYWPSLASRAVSFDDHQYVLDNPLVKNPSAKSVERFFTEVLRPSSVAGYYQPLAMTSLMLDVAMGGGRENFTPFHATSLALHVLNAGLLTILLFQLFGRAWPAAAAGLLFGLHPLTIEPIPWIGERKTLLAAFFAFGSLVFYVGFVKTTLREWRATLYSASLIFFILALLSKPTVVPLSVMLLLLDFWPLGRLNRRAVMEKIPFFVLSAGFAVITVVSQSRASTISMPTEQTAFRVPLIICHNIVFYLAKAVWPTNLSSHYPFPQPLNFSQPMIVVGVIGTCIVLPALAVSLKWTRALATGWLVFLVAALPTMQIIGFSDVIASDKYAYFPSVGLLLMLAWALTRISISPSGSARRGAIVVVAILIITEALTTRKNLAVWKDTETHYSYMIRLEPNAASLHNNLALELADMKRFAEALIHYRKAIELKPGDERTITNLGTALAKSGRRDEAIELYRQALKDLPQCYSIHLNLGVFLAETGKNEEATEQFRIARLQKPDSAEALTNFANGLYTQGQYEEAARGYREAMEVRPDIADIHNNLAVCLDLLGQKEEALQHYQAAVKLDPDHIGARQNLASRLAEAGRLVEASDLLRDVLRREPANQMAQFVYAQLLAYQGQTAEAIAMLKKVLAADRDFQPAAELLEKLLTPASQPAATQPAGPTS